MIWDRVSPSDTPFVASADLAGGEVKAAVRLLTEQDEPGGQRASVVAIAARQVRAWAVLR